MREAQRKRCSTEWQRWIDARQTAKNKRLWYPRTNNRPHKTRMNDYKGSLREGGY